MATTDIGRAVPLLRGEYDPAQTYELNDIVSLNGSLYWHYSHEVTTNVAPQATSTWKVVLSLTDAEGYIARAETAAEEAESAKDDAVTAKTAAETASTTATEASEAATAAKDDAVTARNAAQTAETGAVEAKNAAVSAKEAAQSAASSAGTSATSAGNSAGTAEYYATNAETAAETATTKASEASASASTASSAATTATEAKNTAVSSASTATTKAGEASTSATSAASSAAAAQAVKDSIPQDYTALSEDVADLKTHVEAIADMDTVRYLTATWIQGSMDTGGRNTENTKRVRMSPRIVLNAPVTLSVIDGYRFSVMYYESADATYKTGDGSGWVNHGSTYTVRAGEYINISIAKESETGTYESDPATWGNYVYEDVETKIVRTVIDTTQPTANLFDGTYSTLTNMELDEGKLKNTESGGRTWFNCGIWINDGGTNVLKSNKSIKALGRYYITVTPESSGDNVAIRHGNPAGVGSLLSVKIPFNFEQNQTYTISFDVEGIDTTETGGLIISNVEIVAGTAQTPYVPFATTAIDLAARSSIDELRNSVNDDGIPGYWKIYLESKKAAVLEEVYGVGNHGVVFSYFTDYHYPLNHMDSNGNSDLPNILKYCRDKFFVTDVIFGGDVLTTHSSEEEAISYLAKFHDEFGQMQTKFVFGNHDLNPYSLDGGEHFYPITVDEAYPILYRGMGMEHSVHLEPGMYWYMDNESQKVRFIALNTHNELSEWQSDSDQHAWIIDVLHNTPDGYTVIILPHIMLAYSNSTVSLPDVGRNIKDLVDAFASKGHGTWNSVSYDFTSSDATVACIISGHVHRDLSMESEENYPIISTVCDAVSGSNQTTTRNNATTDDHAFDIVCVDTTAKTVTCVRIGAETEAISDGKRVFRYGT